jgi:hypothetical protein
MGGRTIVDIDNPIITLSLIFLSLSFMFYYKYLLVTNLSPNGQLRSQGSGGVINYSM